MLPSLRFTKRSFCFPVKASFCQDGEEVIVHRGDLTNLRATVSKAIFGSSDGARMGGFEGWALGIWGTLLWIFVGWSFFGGRGGIGLDYCAVLVDGIVWGFGEGWLGWFEFELGFNWFVFWFVWLVGRLQNLRNDRWIHCENKSPLFQTDPRQNRAKKGFNHLCFK